MSTLQAHTDDIMAYQWKKLYEMRQLRSSWYAQLVMKCNICGARPLGVYKERPGCTQRGGVRAHPKSSLAVDYYSPDRV